MSRIVNWNEHVFSKDNIDDFPEVFLAKMATGFILCRPKKDFYDIKDFIVNEPDAEFFVLRSSDKSNVNSLIMFKCPRIIKAIGKDGTGIPLCAEFDADNEDKIITFKLDMVDVKSGEEKIADFLAKIFVMIRHNWGL